MGETEQESDSPAAASELLPLVYEELRSLARARLAGEVKGQTIQATALVHEAYMRLTKTGETPRWNHERHFFGAAAEAMRRILIDRARNKKRLKRGGEMERVPLQESQIVAPLRDDELTAVDEVLDRFAEVDRECCELVKLRYFVGMTVAEVSRLTDVPERTIHRRWAYARAWIKSEIGKDLG